jgi:hypothetical protein
MLLRTLFPCSVLAVCTLAGCGLIDPDITEFDLSLPEQEFIVDTSQWGLADTMTEFPTIPCDPADDMCATLASAVCAEPDCLGTATCDVDTSTCKVSVQVALSQSINLVDEKPELQTIENQPFINVTIDNVDYEVLENTLNFASPSIELYVAPQNIMSPGSADARLVGTLGSVPAMSQLDWTPMLMDNSGENNLRQFMGDYRSIFNIIAGAVVVLEAGMPMPAGRAVARVRVDAHAGL